MNSLTEKNRNIQNENEKQTMQIISEITDFDKKCPRVTIKGLQKESDKLGFEAETE